MTVPVQNTTKTNDRHFFNILAAICILIAFFTTIRIAFSTGFTCSVINSDGTSQECPSVMLHVCDGSSGFEFSSTVTSTSSSLFVELVCPWKPHTTGVSITFLMTSVLAFLIAFISSKKNSQKFHHAFVGVSILSSVGLIIAFGLMISEIVEGQKAGDALINTAPSYLLTFYNAIASTATTELGRFITAAQMTFVLWLLMLFVNISLILDSRSKEVTPSPTSSPSSLNESAIRPKEIVIDAKSCPGLAPELVEQIEIAP